MDHIGQIFSNFFNSPSREVAPSYSAAAFSPQILKRQARILKAEIAGNHIRAHHGAGILFVHFPCHSFYEIFDYPNIGQLLHIRDFRIFLIPIFQSEEFAKNASRRAARDNLSGFIYFQQIHRLDANFFDQLSSYGLNLVTTLDRLSADSLRALRDSNNYDGFLFHMLCPLGTDDILLWKRCSISKLYSQLDKLTETSSLWSNSPIPLVPDVPNHETEALPYFHTFKETGKIVSICHPTLDQLCLERPSPVFVDRKAPYTEIIVRWTEDQTAPLSIV